MVAGRGKKKMSANITLQGNKAAKNGLPNSHSDSLTVDQIEPNEDAQSDDEQGRRLCYRARSVDEDEKLDDEQGRNADYGEMSGEEGKNLLYHEQGRYAYYGEMSGEEVDKKDDEQAMNADYGAMSGEEGEKVTRTNGDNKAEAGVNTFEDDEIGDQEEDGEEPFEHDNEDRVLDEFEVSEEEDTEEDDVDDDDDDDDDDDEVSEDDAAEEDEVTEEKARDKVSEEATKVKNDKVEAKVKQNGGEAKKHEIERSGAGSKNIKQLNEKSRRKKVQASRLKKKDSEDKPESSRKTKGKKRVQSMGMIFMCTSETKKDCYQYRILGLPESKKDIVEKIYTGMRLFLYDIDLKLMYGIYKAAAPGGYNIEPKAFKSQFPSQVRFKVMENCLPLAEERFKTVIKENYFTKTKFDCLLNSEQVKNLCKLFAPSRKGRPSKKLGSGLKAEKQPISRERKAEKQPISRERNRRQITRDRKRLPPVREEVRHRRHERPRKRPRKAMSPPPLPHQRLPPPLPFTIPSSYVYDRVSDAYRRDPYAERRSPYRDRRDRPLSPIAPYRGAQDPPTERGERYRDVRDPPLDHRYAYGVPRDSYTDGVASYSRRRDPYRDGRASYLESRDPYGERRDPYRDGQDPYVETRHSLRDGRASYYGGSARSELYNTYVRPPLSDSRDLYGDDRGIDFRDSYRRDELLGRRDPHLINSETRNNYVSSRERPLYDETLYPAAYPSRGVYRL